MNVFKPLADLTTAASHHCELCVGIVAALSAAITGCAATAAETAPCRPPTLIALASLPITSVIADADDQSRGVVRRRATDAWGRERLLRRRVDGAPEHAATDAPT